MFNIAGMYCLITQITYIHTASVQYSFIWLDLQWIIVYILNNYMVLVSISIYNFLCIFLFG